MRKDRDRSARSRRRLVRYLRLPAVLAIAALAVGLAWWATTSRPVDGSSFSPTVVVPVAARRETRPTLDPARFVGKAALAHQVAREIPDVLDQLSCYCECDKHAGHKTLLSCYTP